MDVLFLGAAQTVTGSKYLVSQGESRVLVDCGLFQGYKHLRLRNWAALPVDPRSIHAVVLTHAHVDHCGWLPLLCRNGFTGPVHATSGTRDLCAIMLPDSGRLQEEEADLANRKGWSKHRPALPLYTEDDARKSLKQFRIVKREEDFAVAPGLTARLHQAGHIPGASMVRIGDGAKSLLFSGDMGRFGDPVTRDPAVIKEADWLVLESTYGNRRHEDADPAELLGDVIVRTAARSGVVVIPAFAVGRAQSILYHVQRLKAEGRIPDVPVYLNSPMATAVTNLLDQHPEDHRLSPEECARTEGAAKYVETVEESKALNESSGPMVIISASGMATGGRVLHHLKAFAPDPKNTILFTGFQAGGTRGRDMVDGADSVRIHGQDVPVRAEVRNIGCLSAHADADDLLKWLAHFERAPGRVFLTHGESSAADALRKKIESRFRWDAYVPSHLERAALD